MSGSNAQQPSGSTSLQGRELTDQNQAESVESMFALVEQHPERAPVRCRLGRVLLGAGRHCEATAQFQSALQLEPDSVPARLGLARIHHVRNEAASELEYLQSALEVSPRNAAVALQMALHLKHQGRRDEALPWLDWAVDLAPERTMPRVRLAQLLRSMGDFDNACEALDPAEAGYEFHSATEVLALVDELDKLGRHQWALTVLEEAEVAFGPQRDVRLRRARVLNRGEQFRAARTVLDELLEEGREDVEVLREWFSSHKRPHELDEAYPRLEAALAASPHDSELVFACAAMFASARVFGRARELYRQLLGHDRFGESARAKLVKIEASLRRRPVTDTSVASDSHRVRRTIDVVYTWVDGEDPAWRGRFNAVAGVAPEQLSSPHQNEQRYAQFREIDFSLQMLEAHCKFVRKVFIVTDRQWFDLESLGPDFRDKVTFIDHSEILPAESVTLPTFNSGVIEAFLHRIPGLAERFVYFNDDMFLTRTIEWSDLFDEVGRPRAFVRSKRLSTQARARNLALAQAWPGDVHLGARHYATADCFETVVGAPPPEVMSSHVGAVLTRSAQEKTFAAFADRLQPMLRDQLRTSWTVQWMKLSIWHAIDQGWSVIADGDDRVLDELFVNHDLHAEVVDEILDRRPKFCCVNVTPSRRAEFERLTTALIAVSTPANVDRPLGPGKAAVEAVAR